MDPASAWSHPTAQSLRPLRHCAEAAAAMDQQGPNPWPRSGIDDIVVEKKLIECISIHIYLYIMYLYVFILYLCIYLLLCIDLLTNFFLTSIRYYLEFIGLHVLKQISSYCFPYPRLGLQLTSGLCLEFFLWSCRQHWAQSVVRAWILAVHISLIWRQIHENMYLECRQSMAIHV